MTPSAAKDPNFTAGKLSRTGSASTNFPLLPQGTDCSLSSAEGNHPEGSHRGNHSLSCFVFRRSRHVLHLENKPPGPRGTGERSPCMRCGSSALVTLCSSFKTQHDRPHHVWCQASKTVPIKACAFPTLCGCTEISPSSLLLNLSKVRIYKKLPQICILEPCSRSEVPSWSRGANTRGTCLRLAVSAFCQ